MTTSEIGMEHIDTDMVLNSSISNDELEQTIQNSMGGVDSAISDEFFNAFNPLLSLAFILGTEGFRLGLNKIDLNQSIPSWTC